MTKTRKRVHIPAMRDGMQLPFSSGVLVGNTFYLSGHLGIDPNTRQPPETVETEIRLLMENITITLQSAGLKLSDLVSVQIFCPDVTLYAEFNAIYRTYFEGLLPARAFIGSGPLLFGARFEIQGIASKR